MIKPMEPVCSSMMGSSIHSLSPFAMHQSVRPRLPARRRRAMPFAVRRDGYGWDYGGGLVDENMIVLRKRIHEMKMAERNYGPPSHWMEWEKRCYTSYDADVCEAVGLLQTFLMNSRPSLAIGMLALLTLSVPTSLFMVFFRLMEASSSVLSGLNLT